MADIDTTDPVRPPAGTSAEAPGGPRLPIFINYRHEDMPFAASGLYRELRPRFGAENIFFDGGTLKPGMPFLQEITAHLDGPAGAFIALIGSGWESTMDAHRRHNDDDYVLREIELGLQNGWMIIPVLLNDATLPEPASLPQSIRTLPGYQVAHLRQVSMDEDIEDLCARLDEIRAQLPPAGPPRAAGAPEIATMAEPDEPHTGSVELPDIPVPDDEHYQALVDEADNMVIFLGAGANADDNMGSFHPGAPMLPDDSDLADYLADKARYKSGQRGERELAAVAQYARMVRGAPRMLSWVKEILAVRTEPGPVHCYLARLPARLEELGLEERYQMIITPKFDVALEQAMIKAQQPFDRAVYMAPGTQHEGRFVHIPWRSEARPILTPNEYDGFPIVGENGELTRTVIVRINGAVDDRDAGYLWKQNYVITEDHYIDYLRGRPPEAVVPAQILAKLRQASCLFLGYQIADWRLRAFLHWIWQGERPSGATHWAVERNPSRLEWEFWQRSAGIPLYRSALTDYVQGFDRFLVENRGALT